MRDWRLNHDVLFPLHSNTPLRRCCTSFVNSGSPGFAEINWIRPSRNERTSGIILNLTFRCRSILGTTPLALKQSELFRRGPRRAKMGRRGLHAGQVEPEPLAGNFEASADHPGDRTRAGHALTPSRIVVLAAAGLANEIDDVAIAIGKILDQPFAE